MTIQTISKSTNIHSSREKVWEVLITDKFNRIWYAEFSQGTHAVTDWQVGSKVIFKDDSERGLIGKVLINRPPELLSVVYEGLLSGGIEDYESSEATAVKGGRETYTLFERNGITKLSIESDMGEEYFDMMSALWDKALETIKKLAEEMN